MRIVVSGASGFVGGPLVEALRRDGHDVVRLVRRPERADDEVRWDPAKGLLDPSRLAGVDAAVNLSGAGVGDRRWTPAYRAVIRDSRVDSTRTLATALASLDDPPRVLVNASAIGFYGDRGEEVLTERSAPGDGFLADVVRDWEQASGPARDAGIRVPLLRIGLVMGPGGGAFAPLLRAIRLGGGGPLAGGRMWWSWVTLEDVLGAVRFVLREPVDGPVNVTGPEPARNAEVIRALAAAMHRPAVLPVPRVALRTVLGGFADDVVSSQRVVPQVLLDAGFSFRHRTLADAVRWLVEDAPDR
ncbi:TIGR01777 family oxidoreductase [Thalassiella azotivora]